MGIFQWWFNLSSLDVVLIIIMVHSFGIFEIAAEMRDYFYIDLRIAYAQYILYNDSFACYHQNETEDFWFRCRIACEAFIACRADQ